MLNGSPNQCPLCCKYYVKIDNKRHPGCLTLRCSDGLAAYNWPHLLPRKGLVCLICRVFCFDTATEVLLHMLDEHHPEDLMVVGYQRMFLARYH